jgi:hypothetical protein
MTIPVRIGIIGDYNRDFDTHQAMVRWSCEARVDYHCG